MDTNIGTLLSIRLPRPYMLSATQIAKYLITGATPQISHQSNGSAFSACHRRLDIN